ncbi:MAG: hypothetical protein A3A86_06750 [Elusimicrobia bacterium RIFCSPLOWO2_01_FULL_60_11]|nr:MAG: hypothetical protein A3A86_06750 [Elusimicrobia bacterium RIFCSPLOWO2_01_FULL_60_11]
MFKWIATAVIIAGYFFGHPGGVFELTGGEVAGAAVLDYPAVYIPFAPFFHLADHLTILSVHQHIAMLAALNLLLALRRPGVLKFIQANLLYAAVLAAVILIPRPMARLEVKDPDLLIYDAHSHTSHSWDANKSFTPEKNLLWHKKAGFHAAFITDHNVVTGSREAQAAYERDKNGAIPLSGEELSLQNCHLAVIGNTALISNGLYDGSVEGIRRFMGVMKSSRALVIASLPEYWKYHWERKEDFVKWGVRGFEIANAAPIALDFPPSKRAEIVALCRKDRLAMTGITDNHGWGYTAYVWNVARVPGWRNMDRSRLEDALLSRLKIGGDQANQVFVRLKAEPHDNKLWLAADPFLQAWEAARSLPPAHALSCLFWLWVPARLFRRRKPR